MRALIEFLEDDPGAVGGAELDPETADFLVLRLVRRDIEAGGCSKKRSGRNRSGSGHRSSRRWSMYVLSASSVPAGSSYSASRYGCLTARRTNGNGERTRSVSFTTASRYSSPPVCASSRIFSTTSGWRARRSTAHARATAVDLWPRNVNVIR